MNPARPTRLPRRFGAGAAIGALLISGLAVVAPPLAPAASAAVPLPAGAERFRVSQTDTGASTQPYLTPDGQRVFFTSTAADLVTGDENGVSDVFVSIAEAGGADPFAGAPALVSVPDDALADTLADGASSEPAASADGRYVAFTSAATNLVAEGATPGRTSIYIRDTLLGKTFRIQGAAEPDGPSYDADMSDSGRLVVFTSEATDLVAGDTNEVADAFLADLDANGDGVFGDLAITRFFGSAVVPGGSEEARISGDGSTVVFTAHSDALPGDGAAGDFVYRASTGGLTGATLVGRNARQPTIDATGRTFAFVDDDDCDEPAIIAGTLDGNFYYAAAGTIDVDRRVGYIADPVLSADGSRVTWTTTVPQYDYNSPAQELAAPVIRTQPFQWWDSRTTVDCYGLFYPWQDLADGTEASVSASARTVAFSATAPAASTVFAVDTHRHEGLSVSSTQGQLVTPGFMTSIEIPGIPLASLRGYTSTIANAPIYQLPIYQLPIYQLPIYQLPIYQLLITDSPIYQLPIYQLPIYQLPIYQLEFPGGWAQVLEHSPFEGELTQSVTLAEVLTWAEKTLATGSTATADERAAAERIQSLTLGDVDVDNSALSALTLASYILGDAPLDEVQLPQASPDDPATPEERWQDLVDRQGLGFDVDPDWFLSDLDAAGLDIERSGVDAVPVRSLPVASTTMRFISLSSLFLAGTPLGSTDAASFDESARIAMFGKADVTGPLSGQALMAAATVADLAKGAPDSVTLGILLMSMLNRESYPWEQISATSIDPNLMEASTPLTGCDGHVRCDPLAQFQYTFDPGPGEPTRFAAPTATLSTPVGTSPYLSYVSGTGPDASLLAVAPDKQITAERMRVPLPETPGGTVVTIQSYYTATTQPGESRAVGELTSGALSASDELFGAAPLKTFDDPTRNFVNGEWEANPFPLFEAQVYYEWISPQWRDNDDEGKLIHGPAQDEDYYLVNPPPAGKRLVVSTNASDGQLSLSLYSQTTESPLGIEDAGPVPGTPVAEQSGPVGEPAQSGGDAGVALEDQTLVDQTSVGGDGVAQVEAASTDAAPDVPLLVRVTSGNQQPSSSLYSLRVQYIDEAPEVACPRWTPAQTADPGVPGVSDPVDASTNTIFLFDGKRYGDTYGAAEAERVRDALVSLTGDGHVGDGSVDGAVLAIDSSPDVQAARTALDANPCSMTAREALASAVNAFVGQELGTHRSQIRSVVVVGGDDIIPLAPVAQHTSQFTEASHADELRLPRVSDTEPCPPAGGVDPCETPLSAAARTSQILTDDPYGLATAYESLGGHLYVPTVALGRLVETPDEIIATVDRFLAADGVLQADSSLTGGYGAWSELPAQVTEALAWRSSVNQPLPLPWTATDLESRLFPESGESPKVVSVNTHANETQMLPGVPGAESGRFSDSDLFVAEAHQDVSALAGSLIFGIGCHAGNNLPSRYYGDVTDWVDVFSQAGGYIGNTGYGLANNVTTALGERLLGLYAQWLGVTVGGEQVSSGAALTYAKQSYLGGLGLYSGYDEKALMESVYYGLPMYTLAEPHTTEMPLPEAPDLTLATSGGITTASLSFQPVFDEQTAPDGGEYYTVEGSALAVPTAQGVLPSIVRRLEPQPGLVPRGVILTSLTTTPQPGTPALAPPTVGVPQTSATGSGSAFPSSYATITRQETPTGPVDLLVITPARVEVTRSGQGTTELFTSFTAEVVYGPDTSADSTPPVVSSITVPGMGSPDIEVRASDAGGPIAAVVVLAQPEGTNEWQRLDAEEVVVRNGDGTVAERYWRADAPVGPFRWMVQIIDASGNVTVDTARGHLDVAGAAAPTLGDPGPDVTVPLGERLLRAVQITDAVPGERFTASTTLTDAAGEATWTAPATVQTGADGIARALIDQPVVSPGSFTVTLSVCRGNACTTASFGLETPPLDEAPVATVVLLSSDNPVEPTSILTASATATDPDGDPDGDPVEATYAWMRNGVAIPGESDSTLDLAGIAQTDDVIRVTVTPDDGSAKGHSASDEVVVGREAVEPPAPTITATATTAAGPYVEGQWATTPVTVTFTCTAGAPLLATCPAPKTVASDTTAAGVLVAGTVTDLLGRSASASVLVRLDATAPDLFPVVTPQTVEVGGTAVATPHATDASSGVASQACDAPQTATAGAASVSCSATDVAGNSATALAYYTVEAPVPAGPVLTIAATTADGAYVEGEWSRKDVTVTFSCASGAAVTTCPETRIVEDDTDADGLLVTGTMRDALGRSVEGQILVRLDGTAPVLAPVVTPSRVEVGASASASANATDPSSGVASQSCDAPQTATAGAAFVTCRATDVAGNTRTALAHYTVVAKGTPTPSATPTPTPSPTPPATPTPPAANPAPPAANPAPRNPSSPSARPPRTGGSGGSTQTPSPLLPGGALPDRTPLGPVAADGSSVFAPGSGVPIIFRAHDDGGAAIGTPGYVTAVVLLSSQALSGGAKANAAYFMPFPFVYADAAEVWLGSIPTADLDPGQRYTYRVDLADGTSFTLTFGVSG